MPDPLRGHARRRRDRSDLLIARLAVLAVTVFALVRLLTLPEPARSGPAGEAQPTPAAVLPALTWSGPEPTTVPGVLSDGAVYQPRFYLTADTSVGLVIDGTRVRLVLRAADGTVTDLRRVTAGENPQFDGFVASGDTLVWAESTSPPDGAVQTTIWRSNWRAGSAPAVITTNTADAVFFGGEHDLVLANGRVYWAAIAVTDAPKTEVRSIPLGGGRVNVTQIDGEFGLAAWPWAVSASHGRGTPVQLVNLDTKARVSVPTQTIEAVTCGPVWCQLAILGDNKLTRIDLMHPDGSARRPIAGPESTPTIVDVAVLDRFVPLATELSSESAVGLSLYDVQLGRTDLVATDAANVQGRGGFVWWSTGFGSDLRWHAIDLRTAA